MQALEASGMYFRGAWQVPARLLGPCKNPSLSLGDYPKTSGSRFDASKGRSPASSRGCQSCSARTGLARTLKRACRSLFALTTISSRLQLRRWKSRFRASLGLGRLYVPEPPSGELRLRVALSRSCMVKWRGARIYQGFLGWVPGLVLPLSSFGHPVRLDCQASGCFVLGDLREPGR